MSEWTGKGGTLRTPETEAKYKEYKAQGGLTACPLCERKDKLKEFTYWHVIENLFPYDHIARVHHMIVLNRHAPDAEFTQEERDELHEIKYGYAQDHYQFIFEPVGRQKSIPSHSHIHLIIAK
ncbi:MAG TPA: hypothetical protein PK109_03470 [Candidatus Paceibacterota bacterium]|nr:hypothetical protein [Candidatus Paceibacterota bacterium]